MQLFRNFAKILPKLNLSQRSMKFSKTHHYFFLKATQTLMQTLYFRMKLVDRVQISQLYKLTEKNNANTLARIF